MAVLQEFRKFAMKGNVVDLAVGVIIGGAFGKIVSVLVEKILMPPIGLLIGGMDFSQLRIILKVADSAGKGEVAIAYGELIQTLINFLIIAWALFAVIKGMNALRHHDDNPPAPKAPPEDIILLREIRDSLRRPE